MLYPIFLKEIQEEILHKGEKTCIEQGSSAGGLGVTTQLWPSVLRAVLECCILAPLAVVNSDIGLRSPFSDLYTSPAGPCKSIISFYSSRLV